MRIALVILHADAKRGGAERYTVDLARGLVARGHFVSLLASSFGDESTGATPVPLDATGATRLAGYRRFLDSLDAHLLDNPYDIVHAMLPVRRCDVYHPHAGIAAEAIVSGHTKYDGALRRGMAKLANRFNRKRRKFAAVERELLLGNKPPVVLCLSDYIKATVRRHYPLPDERLVRLFNAVDLHKFNPLARQEVGRQVREGRFTPEQVVGLIIAQDFERKGLREAISALDGFETLHNHRPKLVLAVVGKQKPDRYQRQVYAEGLAGRVDFAGGTTDPVGWYAAADFFVLPTRHDPCSLVVLEALAMGVPVISTVFNGACEIMTDGVHGFVLKDPTDVDSLRDCYRKMMDESLRRKMREACIALRPRLSQEHHLDQLIGIYDNVLGGKSAKPRAAEGLV